MSGLMTPNTITPLGDEATNSSAEKYANNGASFFFSFCWRSALAPRIYEGYVDIFLKHPLIMNYVILFSRCKGKPLCVGYCRGDGGQTMKPNVFFLSLYYSTHCLLLVLI